MRPQHLVSGKQTPDATCRSPRDDSTVPTPPAPRLSLLITVLVAALAGAGRLGHGLARPGRRASRRRATSSTPPTRDGAFNEITSFGVHSLRVVLYWHDVAPGGDLARQAEVRHDRSVGVRLVAGTSRCSTRPRRAAGPCCSRVSGPRAAVGDQRRARHRHAAEPERVPHVHDGRRPSTSATRSTTWSIWNEPNHPAVPAPAVRRAAPPVVAAALPRLYFAALRGLRGRRRGAAGARGRDAPRGTGKVVAPLTFLRGALCLTAATASAAGASSCRPPATRTTPTRRAQGPFYKPPGPNDVTIGVLARLTHALDRAGERRRAIAQAHADLPDGVRHPEQARPAAGRLARRARPSTTRSPSASPTTTRASRRSRSTCCATTTPRAGPRLARYGGFESGLTTAGGKAEAGAAGVPAAAGAAKRRGSRGRSGASCARPAARPRRSSSSRTPTRRSTSCEPSRRTPAATGA